VPITQAEARAVTLAFARDYPGALELLYYFREDVEKLYGYRVAEISSNLKGGYLPKEQIHNGRSYRGRVDVPLGKMNNTTDMLVTLRHEVLGHYGVNTFKPTDKRALLDGLIAAHEEPGLKPLWEEINRRYADTSMSVRAEEVWALHCETLAPGQHVGQAYVRERGEQSFMETCIARVRLMQAADLHNIVCMVANGIHNRTRIQQTFPQINELFRRDNTMEPRKPFYEIVAEKLIEQLKAGTAPWQRPWEPGAPNAYLPMNPITGKRYKGINAIHLMAQGRGDARWMTYRQAISAGAQVRKGEKGTLVQHWKFSEEQNKVDESGRPVFNAKGESVKETVQFERPRVFFATVFNAEQIDGLPPIQKKEQTWSAIERAEHILKESGAKITHAPGNRALYRPETDSIHLPDRDQFSSADNYYATCLHELGHWTGHVSRLDRDLTHPFGSEGYAKEELRAEIASMILGDELGIGHDPGQHVAYVGSWIKALQDEPLEVFRAAADAEKIHDYVLAFEQKQEQSHTKKLWHEMTLDEFSTYVRVQECQTAARKWEVIDKDTGVNLSFADAPSPEEAIREVHHRKVNNALYFNTPEARSAGLPTSSFPPPEVLATYPDLVDKFSDAISEINEVFQRELVSQAQRQSLSGERRYINVPFREKDEAKQLGARWDRKEQSWYVPAGVGIDTAHFAKWTQEGATSASEGKPTQQTRQYLAVPYEQRNVAKDAGALWDKAAKSWYVGPRADMAKLEQWKPENVKSHQGPSMTPREEFAEAMRSIGLFTGSNSHGDHPIMDGKRHRVPVEGGKNGALDGFYVGHLDGHPAGRIINNKTGADITWKSKGYILSDQEKVRLQAVAAENLARRVVEQEQIREAAAQRVGQQLADLMPVEQPTPYLETKGIKAQVGVFTDRESRTTYIPAFDADGKIWTMQYIQADGTKRFAKDGKKEGCFHPVGGMDALTTAPTLVISEGYATAASLAEGLGYATVAAFDAGNLPHVARTLHEKFPNKPIIIAGDDDKSQEIERGHNPGRIKAEEAAKVVGGKAIFPIFAPEEQQSNPNGFTDFNDLANKSKLGRNGLKRQVGAAVGRVKNQQKQRTKKQQKSKQPHRVARIG